MLEHKSGNISETRKHRRIVIMEGLWEFTNALSNGTISDLLRPPFPQHWWFATPTQNFNRYYLRNGVKLRTSTFVCTFIRSIGTNTVKNFRKSRFGRTQELRKIFRAPMYRAHRAVIFAVAQSSCNYTASRGKKHAVHFLRHCM